MMNKNITIKNVSSFIKGNFLYYKDILFGRPKFIKEQVLYRLNVCKDTCIVNDECEYCGCSPVKKSHLIESCNNGNKFPNLMNEIDWNKYKKENDIHI